MTPVLALSTTPLQRVLLWVHTGPEVWWIALAGGFLALAVLTVSLFPRYLVDRTIVSKKMQQPTTAEYLKAENDVRATLLQGLGALVLLLGGFVIWQQGLATRDGQVNDRFTHAIDQLGSHSLDVRLGGIYALEQIAKDSPGDYGPIVEILTAFLHEHAPWPPANGVVSPKPPGTQSPAPRPPADIQAALTVLGRMVIPKDWNGPRLDLSHTDLRGADLRGANLVGMYFVSTHLEEGRLSGVHLEGAVLSGAYFDGAELNAAHLESTFLDAAHLKQASLISAHLEGASLDAAYLEDAHLSQAYLDGASLVSAKLQGAFLNEADLDGADFKGANLTGADLRNAQHLNTALNLTKEQLASAKWR
jgi:uncharacterized protein YjbI with pentapeptide repeats